MSVAPISSPILVGDNDPRIPTQDENDAMVGTSGTPSSSNKFVTADHPSRSNNMNITGDQTISDTKTFSTPPVMPGNPASANDMANKDYALSLLS